MTRFWNCLIQRVQPISQIARLQMFPAETQKPNKKTLQWKYTLTSLESVSLHRAEMLQHDTSEMESWRFQQCAANLQVYTKLNAFKMRLELKIQFVLS